MTSRLAAVVACVALAAACAADPVGGAAPSEAADQATGAATDPGAPSEASTDASGAEPTAGDGSDDGSPGGGSGAESPGSDVSDAPSAPTPGAWTRLGDAPRARTEVAAAAFGGAVWAAGGFDADGAAVADVQVYDPAFDLWEDGPPLPETVHHAALVSTGERLLLVGGYRGDGFDRPSDAVHVLDAATGTWRDGPPLPEPRAAGAAAWDGQRVVYAGGVGPDGVADDVFALEGDRWVRLGGLSEPREHLAAAADGAGRVWFLGGRRGGLEGNLATVDVVRGAEVRRLGEIPTARGGVAGFHHPGAGACAVGGEAPDATFGEVECIDADGVVQRLPGLQAPRHGLGAAVSDGVVYVVLGGPRPRLAVSATVEALRLDP